MTVRINAVAASCQGPLEEFLDKTNRRYGPSLGVTQTQPGGKRRESSTLGEK